MIAQSKPIRSKSESNCRFISLLPTIQAIAKYAFRHQSIEQREEAVEEIVASAYVAYCRLTAEGRADRAFASTLAGYAVAQFRAGRRVGSRMNSRDVMAAYPRRFPVHELDVADENCDQWQIAIVPDRKTPVPDQAAFRCDFPAWLERLPKRKRRIAKALAASHTTSEVAERYGVSLARISQLRRELKVCWEQFHGERTVHSADTAS